MLIRERCIGKGGGVPIGMHGKRALVLTKTDSTGVLSRFLQLSLP